MNLLCFLLSFLYLSLTVVDSRKNGGYKEAILSCNAYIDTMIEEVLTEQSSYFDPHPIKESFLLFHKKVVFVDFRGEAKLSEGYISGLRNLRRVSSCSLSFDQGRLKVAAKLEVDKMSFNFSGSVKAININNDIHGEGSTSKVSLSTTISLDADGKGSVLDHLNVDQISDMALEVEGMGFLGFMEETTKTSIHQFFKALIEKLIEVQMKTTMVERMKEKPFSLEKFDLDIGDLEVTTTVDESLIGEPVYRKEDANSYITNVLENRFQLEADYSKLRFPDFLTDDRIDNVYISQEADNYMKIKDGYLENLTKLKLINDCSQPILRSTNITFTCILGFQRLTFKYLAEAHNGNAVSNFDVVALIDDTKFSVKITTTVTDNIPTMLDMNVSNLGKIQVKAAHTIAEAPSTQAGSKFNRNILIYYFSDIFKKILLGKFKDVLGYSIYKTPVHFIK